MTYLGMYITVTKVLRIVYHKQQVDCESVEQTNVHLIKRLLVAVEE